jgi:hypothetical protein
MLDDGAGLDDAGEGELGCGGNPSAEGLMAAIAHGRRRVAEEMRAELVYGRRVGDPSVEGRTLERGANPSAEVREPAAVYRITARKLCAASRSAP